MIIPLFKLVKVKLKAILFLGLLFVAMVIQAQERLTLNSFLSSTIDSNLVDQDSTTITLLSSKNYNIPLIKSTQFRLETRRFIETFQEFSVRIKPNNFREISSQKNIYANKIQEVRLENKIKINESLKNRYLLALDYIFNKKTAILYAIKQQQLKDKLDLLGHQVLHEDFEVKDVIESEEDLLAINLKIIQLRKI